MSIGIANRFRKTAQQIVTASIVPVNITDLTFPIAAAQAVHARWWIPFTLGATGGFRFIITGPAAITQLLTSFKVFDFTTANTYFGDVQTALAAFTNASAVAGEYLAEIELGLSNGVNAGTIALQFAQNNSQATNFTVLPEAYCEICYL